MIRKDLERNIKKILEEENLPFSGLKVEPSRFGDYSTNIALRLPKFKNYHNPLEIANFFVARLQKNPLILETKITQPGFINFIIDPKEAAKFIPKITKDRERYLLPKTSRGKFARVEFVSANPTGPLHVGNARGGPLGDSLAAILEAAGYKVLREYYNNNIGTQVDIFGDSLVKLMEAKVTGTNFQSDGAYQGEYLEELAEKMLAKFKIDNIKDIQNKTEQIKKEGIKVLTTEILETCGQIGIFFAEVFNESDFQKTGSTQAIIEKLATKGVTKEKEGAIWFAPKNDFLQDKESVLVRADGRPTYFADDIAYHNLKFKADPDLVVNVLGSNHHGHVPRVQAAIAALGYNTEKFKVILYQYVRVKRGNEVVKMSKRAGNFVTAKEVLDEVGKDAFRFLLLMHSANSHLDFDLELAKKQSNENPVYYVQYAYARMSSILAKAPELKEEFDPEILTTQPSFALVKKILELPSLIEDIASNFAVHQLAFYALELAEEFHQYYEKEKVITEDQKQTMARLELIKAARITLGVVLKLLGVAAPEKM